MTDASRNPLVIVLDDDAAVRSALHFALEMDGFRVESFASGEDLLESARPGEPCCMVLDEILPGASGLEVLRQLRDRGVDDPAILITTNPKPWLLGAAAAAGARVVEKPLLGDVLVSNIHAALMS